VANDFLKPERALIFRITHRDNIKWMLDNGLHCRHSPDFDPNFINIGNADLIDKRNHHPVKHEMGGTLGDYVPFYFTPFSPMLLNIKTGRGVPKRSMDEIVILATSLPRLQELEVPFIFTDRHAYLAAAQASSDLDDLDWIDWEMLRARDFKRDPENPLKFERYQAEALIHRHLPMDALLGVFCYNQDVGDRITRRVEKRGIDLKVVVRPGWYI
jgi:ssDNA thymidine ADP-ribosyltransferase, DarT